MSRSAVERLRDIVESIDLAESHANGSGNGGNAPRTDVSDALLFRIAVICEAASEIPAEVRALAPEVHWRGIAAMRSHVLGGYWQIDPATVLDTIANDLKPLRTAAYRLIALIERSEA